MCSLIILFQGSFYLTEPYALGSVEDVGDSKVLEVFYVTGRSPERHRIHRHIVFRITIIEHTLMD